MASLFRSGKPKEPERPKEPARERSAEEQLLAEKARAAAAKREAERRAQTGDVSNFLDDILTPVTAEAQPGPAEPPAPAVDRLLANEPGQPEPPTPPTPPTPFETEPAGSAVGAAGAVPAAGSEEEAGDRKIQAAEANRRTLSATLASSWAGIMALGRSGEDVQRPAFEPEIVAGIFDRTVELLAVRRRRLRELEFEPEVAADAEGSPAAQRTAILSPGARPADAQPPPAGPRPGDVGSEPAYSLDDLPALPAEGAAAGDEPADRPPEAEPALQEDDLDDHALREALAAAEAASRQAEPAPATPPTPVTGEQAAGGAVREAPSPASPAPTAVPEKHYSLEDLPQAPSGAERSSPSDGTGGVEKSRRTEDDRLGEEALPELPAGAAAAGAPPGPGSLVTLERAVDRAVEPGKTDTGLARGGSASGAPRVAAENAADLSVQQLAEMEHYIESQVDTVVAPGSALAETARGGGLSLSGLVPGTVKAVRRLTVRALHALDRWLDPYCLSGKRLLGIVGILLWAGLIAYVLKVWVIGRHGE